MMYNHKTNYSMDPLDLFLYPIMCLLLALFFTDRFGYWFSFMVLFCTAIAPGVIVLLIIPPHRRRTWWICNDCRRWDYSESDACPHCGTPNKRRELGAKTDSLR